MPMMASQACRDGARAHLFSVTRRQRLQPPQFIARQPGFDLLHEDRGDDFAARRIGMNEIGRNQARLRVVPARHGSGAAHRCERVEESAARIRRDTPLHVDDARNSIHGFDVARPGAMAAIHRAHHQNRGVGQRSAHAADGLAQFLLVLLVDEVGEIGLVGSVVDGHQIGMAMLQFRGPVRGVEHAREDRDRGAVESDGVVDDARAWLFGGDSEEANGAIGR